MRQWAHMPLEKKGYSLDNNVSIINEKSERHSIGYYDSTLREKENEDSNRSLADVCTDFAKLSKAQKEALMAKLGQMMDRRASRKSFAG